MLHNNLNKQQELYYHSYARHAHIMHIKRVISFIYSLVCAFIPPLSIPYTIFYIYQSKESVATSYFSKLALVFLASIVPILSGILTALMLNEVLEKQDANFPIVKMIADHKYHYLKGNTSHHAMKVKMMQCKGIPFSKLDKSTKPKRVVEYVNTSHGKHTYVYMDKAQLARRDLMANEKTAKSVTLDLYQKSYAESMRTYADLQATEHNQSEQCNVLCQLK